MTTSVSAPGPISSRIEIEREGKLSYLAYDIDGEGWISLLYTEVAEEMRHRGIANEFQGRGTALEVELLETYRN